MHLILICVCADVNGDGEINVVDITALIDIIMSA